MSGLPVSHPQCSGSMVSCHCSMKYWSCLRGNLPSRYLIHTMAKLKTADLSDAYSDILHYAEPIFRDYGGVKTFGGMISTVKCFEDNVLVKKALSEPGQGKVLVVDGGGSMRRGMLGDNLATMALNNGWSGVIMYGCIRDSEDISRIDVGVKALGTMPLKSIKKGQGDQDIQVKFAGITFIPGHYVYADVDGIVVSPKELTLPPPKL